MFETGDLIEIADLSVFPKSYSLSYDKPYEVQCVFTCGSFEIIDNKGKTCWIDVSNRESLVTG